MMSTDLDVYPEGISVASREAATCRGQQVLDWVASSGAAGGLTTGCLQEVPAGGGYHSIKMSLLRTAKALANQ